MELEIIRPVMISGESASAGSIVEIADSDGYLLMGMGKAKPAQVKEPEPVVEPIKPAAKKTTKTTTED
jgi:hypothetical protein